MMIEITESCGNVFEDLGFPKDEAAELALRVDLACLLLQTIAARGWTAAEAAVRLNAPLRMINTLLHGNRDELSREQLVNLVSSAGLPIPTPAPASKQMTKG